MSGTAQRTTILPWVAGLASHVEDLGLLFLQRMSVVGRRYVLPTLSSNPSNSNIVDLVMRVETGQHLSVYGTRAPS
jgi:hypothetical protein